jgi:prolyl oligopeptidase
MRLVVAALLSMTISSASLAAQVSDPSDPYLWLEDVSGAKPMAWVKEHNARTQAMLEAEPRYQR